MRDFETKGSTTSGLDPKSTASELAPGKRTLTEMLPIIPSSAPVQRAESNGGAAATPSHGARQSLYDLFGVVQRKATAVPPPERNPQTTPPAMAPHDAGSPLPEPVRHKMEAAFGARFGDVRVHEGAQAPSVGAIAYASGAHLHFAPGRYDPFGHAGQELLGHELAHVVQQREGRVAMPQGKGAPVNADPGLEHEADVAGARAARGEAVDAAAATRTAQHGESGAAGEHATAAGQVIQRAVGFEFELSSWTSKKNGQPLHKKDDIIDRTSDGFRVEADDAPGGASDVEFVVLASDTRAEAKAAVTAAAKLATDLAAYADRADRTAKASDHGGEQGVTIDVTSSKDAIVQVTAAVPLEHIGAMFGALRGPLELQGGNTEEAVRSVEAFEKAGSQDHPLKPKLKGFLLLLANYLQLGAQKNVKKWPKAIFPIMARTTFTKMMGLLDRDDQAWITENLDNWVDFVVAAAGLSGGDAASPQGGQDAAKTQPVIASVFNDLEAGKHHRLATTREDWLKDMPNNDRLSRGHDSWFEGMGEYGNKTDKLLPADAEAMASKAASSMAPELTKIVHGYEDAASAEPADVHAAPSQSTQQGGASAKPAPSAEAPLFELRALGNKQISEWVATADTAFAQIEEALGGARYQGPGWQPKTPSAQPQGGAAQHQPDSGEFQETEDPTRRYRPNPGPTTQLPARSQPPTPARRRSCCVIM